MSEAPELSQADFLELRTLEEALWRAETRFDLRFQEETFAPEFFEFGRSGRVYSRADAIRTEMQPIRAKLPLADFRAALIDGRTALVTYVSEVQYEELEKSNRCSIWSKRDGRWRLRFHQGTSVRG